MTRFFLVCVVLLLHDSTNFLSGAAESFAFLCSFGSSFSILFSFSCWYKMVNLTVASCSLLVLLCLRAASTCLSVAIGCGTSSALCNSLSSPSLGLSRGGVRRSRQGWAVVSVEAAASYGRRRTALLSSKDRDAIGDIDDVQKKIAFASHINKRKSMKYQVVAAEAAVPLAKRLATDYPDR